MSDKGAMFCTACGTVSMLEGNCPQCATPLKRLGKVGAINESKRATQQMINKSSEALDLQSIKRLQLGDSDSYPLQYIFKRKKILLLKYVC